jgi:hypothetical protein
MVTIDAGLGVFVGEGFAVHENELAAHEADAVGAGFGDHREFEGQFEVGLEVDQDVIGGFGGDALQAGQGAQGAAAGGQAVLGGFQAAGGGVENDLAGFAVDDRQHAGPCGFQHAGGTKDGRDAEGAQHDRGVAIRAAFGGDDGGEFGRLDQRRISRAQKFGGEDGAGGEIREAAEGQAGEVAQDAARDFADFLGAAQPAFVVAAGERQDGLRLGVRLVHHRGLGAGEAVGDAGAGAAQEAGWAQHVQIGVDERRDFGLALLRQAGQFGLQLLQLAAGGGDGVLQPRHFGGGVGGGDFAVGKLQGGFGRLMDRTDANAW